MADYFAWENAERLRAHREHEERMAEQRVVETQNNLDADITRFEAYKSATDDTERQNRMDEKIKVARVKAEVKINRIRTKSMERRAVINQKIEDLQERHKVQTAKRNASLAKIRDKVTKKVARNTLFVEKIKGGAGIIAASISTTEMVQRSNRSLANTLLLFGGWLIASAFGFPVVAGIFSVLLLLNALYALWNLMNWSLSMSVTA